MGVTVGPLAKPSWHKTEIGWEWGRKYRAANKEKITESIREWQRANPEKVRAAQRKFYYESKTRDTMGHWALRAYHAAKTRAVKKGLPFDIDREYVQSLCVIRCPVLGLELAYNARGTPPNCASLDRIQPELGYVRGNVVVISYLANTIKQNATSADVRAVAEWMEMVERPGWKDGYVPLSL